LRYYIINCITTFQKEKQNWKQFRKRKRFRKRLLSAGSRRAAVEALEPEAPEAEAPEAEMPEAEVGALRVAAEALKIQVLPHWTDGQSLL
jgi:hypothetical protein